MSIQRSTKRSLESLPKRENLFVFLHLNRRGLKMERLKPKHSLNLCCFTAQVRQLLQLLHIHTEAILCELTNLCNFHQHMLMSRCLETEGQNAQIHHRQMNLTLHGLRKARKNETDRYCSIVIQGSCLITCVNSTRVGAPRLRDQGLLEVLILPHERLQELIVSSIYQSQLINHLGDKSRGEIDHILSMCMAINDICFTKKKHPKP